MRLIVFATLLVLGVLGGLLGVERSLPDLAREQLVEFGFDELVSFEAIELPSPELVVVRGAGLHDPATGELTAWVERLEIHFDEGLREGRAPLPVALQGRGGRCLLRLDAAGDEMTFVTALIALIDRIVELIPESDGPRRPLPAMTFDDLDLTVHAPGLPLTRLAGVRTTIVETAEGTDVVVDPLTDGEVRMGFDSSGMRYLEVVDMTADPTLIHIIPGVGPELSEQLRPTGQIDVMVTLDHTDGELGVGVDGTARNLVVRTELVPVPLGPAVTRFRYEDDELHIDEALVKLAGGRLRASMGGPLDDLRVELDVQGAEFRQWIIELVPGLRDVAALRYHDGGAFDLALVLDGVDLEGTGKLPSVEGGGGFHVRRASLVTPGTPLLMEDLVGRFEIDDVALTIPRLSARVFEGSVTGTGSMQLDTLSYDTTLRVEDVDIGPLHPALHAGCTCTHRASGWLQGEVTLYGTLDGETLPNAFGQASIRAGNLWDTPLVEAILLALPERKTKGARGRQRLEASFSSFQDHVTIDSMRIESDLFTLTGEDGWIDSQRNIELTGSVFQVPFGVVGKAVQLLADQLLLRIEITGSLDEPVVTPLPLPVVTGTLRSIYRAVGGLFSSDEEEPAEAPQEGR